MFICVDFDGTVVDHAFPAVGAPVPGALEWLRKFQAKGARIILWTMRSKHSGRYGDTLAPAVEYLENNGVPLFGVNRNPAQDGWTSSPKAHGHMYIDDLAIGCPLLPPFRPGGEPVVDWEKVGPLVMEQL